MRKYNRSISINKRSLTVIIESKIGRLLTIKLDIVVTIGKKSTQFLPKPNFFVTSKPKLNQRTQLFALENLFGSKSFYRPNL